MLQKEKKNTNILPMTKLFKKSFPGKCVASKKLKNAPREIQKQKKCQQTKKTENVNEQFY